jgi:hypothetical protein
MDPINHMLHQGGIAISDWFSDKLKDMKTYDKTFHLHFNVQDQTLTISPHTYAFE